MGHGHVHPRPDGSRDKCGGPGICGSCSAELIQSQNQQVLKIEGFAQARQRMSQAFRDDKGLLQAYHANLAMLVLDRHGIVAPDARNALATDVLSLLFGLTQEEATPP